MKSRIYIALVICLFITKAWTQTFNAALNVDEILIGEPVRYSLTVVQEGASEEVDYTPHQEYIIGKSSSGEAVQLELLQPFKDTNYQVDGNYVWKGEYVLTYWDSSYVTLFPEQVKVGGVAYTSNANLLLVTLPMVDEQLPMHDIFELFTPVEEPFPLRVWVVLGVILLLLVLGVLLWKKKRKKNETVLVLSALEEALLRMDQLEQSKLYEKDLKEYYAELSIVLRAFLGKHYQLGMLDKTSVEIIRYLKKKGLSTGLIVQINELLTKSDLVKFAKSTPPQNEVFQVTEQARHCVKTISVKNKVNE